MRTSLLLSSLFALLTATASAGEGTPREQIDKLYGGIVAGEVEAAFNHFFVGSLMLKQKEDVVKGMGGQARAC